MSKKNKFGQYNPNTQNDSFEHNVDEAVEVETPTRVTEATSVKTTGIMDKEVDEEPKPLGSWAWWVVALAILVALWFIFSAWSGLNADRKAQRESEQEATRLEQQLRGPAATPTPSTTPTVTPTVEPTETPITIPTAQ